MAKKNIQASMEKWQRNTQASTQAYKAGVNAVTESPTSKAADNVDKYRRGVMKAADDGKYERNLRAVTLSEWKEAAANKGAANLANGVQNVSARGKRNMADELAYAQTVSDQIASMPNDTEADAEQRALAAIRLMRQFKKNG